MISANCQACGVKIKAPDSAAGKNFACPRCGSSGLVPHPPDENERVRSGTPPPLPEPAPPLPIAEVVTIRNNRLDPRLILSLAGGLAIASVILLAGVLALVMSKDESPPPVAEQKQAPELKAEPVTDPDEVRRLGEENARLKKLLDERLKTAETKPRPQKSDGPRVLDYLETLRAIQERRLEKGDRIRFMPTTSFDVDKTLGTDKAVFASLSWAKKTVFVVPTPLVKDRIVAGFVRLGGAWEIHSKVHPIEKDPSEMVWYLIVPLRTLDRDE